FGRRVARESLGADGGHAAVLVQDADRRVVRAAVLVRDRIAGVDRVALAAPLRAGGDVERPRADVPVELAREVEVQVELVIAERARVGGGRGLVVLRSVR